MTATASWVTKPHYVYRIFNRAGDLLYIGCTVNVEKRLKQHRRKEWWPRPFASVMVDGPYPDRNAGRAAEDVAIETEHPRHALSSRQVGQLAAAATHQVGADGMTPLTRATAGRRQAAGRSRGPAVAVQWQDEVAVRALDAAERHKPLDGEDACTCGTPHWSVAHVVLLSVRSALAQLGYGRSA